MQSTYWPKVMRVGSVFKFVKCSTVFTLLNICRELGFVNLETWRKGGV